MLRHVFLSMDHKILSYKTLAAARKHLNIDYTGENTAREQLNIDETGESAAEVGTDNQYSHRTDRIVPF